MRYAYVTSISPSYMFSLNCNFNSNAFYDTNAEYVVIYDSWVRDNKDEMEYIRRCETAFPFKVRWVFRDDYTNCYHSSKYAVAATLQDDYDAVCLIDSDLFICTDTRQYFERAANEKVLITAEHVFSNMRKDMMFWDDYNKCNNRHVCHIADFPVFVNPKVGHQFFLDWKFNTVDGDWGSEWQHPLVAFNRAVLKNFKQEELVVLPGKLWVCDNNYWSTNYEIGLNDKGKLCITSDYTGQKQPVGSIHNKWWKDGRANGEFAYWKGRIDNEKHMIPNLDRGEKNMNTIRDFMVKFNDMTPATKRGDYYKPKMDWRKYHAEWTGV